MCEGLKNENQEDMDENELYSEGMIEDEENFIKGALNDHLYYMSPLKKINTLEYVRSKLELLAKINIEYYKQLEGSLTNEEKDKFQRAIANNENYK